MTDCPTEPLIDPNLYQAFDRQQLLFAGFPSADRFAHAARVDLAAGFRRDGYAVCRNIPDVHRALETAMGVMVALAAGEPFSSLGFHGFRLAKADRIPVCDSILGADYQSLHFDYGLPVLPGKQQALYGVVALYCPAGSNAGTAQTRLVPLKSLREATRAIGPEEAARRLHDYARTHGDGWRRPSPVNTGRVSLLLRFLDAVFAERRFAALIESDSAGFIREATGEGGTALSYLDRESALLLAYGINLDSVEERVRLEPGEMLLLDNLAVAHGRFGRRQPREIWQMLFGLPALDAPAIERAVRTVCAACAG